MLFRKVLRVWRATLGRRLRPFQGRGSRNKVIIFGGQTTKKGWGGVRGFPLQKNSHYFCFCMSVCLLCMTDYRLYVLQLNFLFCLSIVYIYGYYWYCQLVNLNMFVQRYFEFVCLEIFRICLFRDIQNMFVQRYFKFVCLEIF